ncbi:MAG: beta-hydroxyacyl-ACP dehydratase [Prevotella sp.]|nr:beta-hydroxyacyl-ACP dehydratase [Candidatus Prevotella equi]
MLLKDKFFTIKNEEHTGELSCRYDAQLLEDCECYKGHFPGKPVSPGVCNIEMIRECSELLCGKDLKIDTIKMCRLTEIASPSVCPEVSVTVSLSPNSDSSAYTVTAEISDAEKSYMTLKGQFVVAGNL